MHSELLGAPAVVVMQRPAGEQQCARCVMSAAVPDIRFDENGVCNYCTEFLSRMNMLLYDPVRCDKELRGLVEKIKRDGRGREYDCITGMSGGIDSCYVAYLLKQLGLRPLAVHMDNGWNSETAVKNIRRVLTNLGIDLQTEVLDWEEFRDLQLSFLKASVPEVETPTDMAIPAVLHKAAAQHGVKYVIMGGNYATEGILPMSWHYNAKDLKFLRAVHRLFGEKKLRLFPTFGFMDEIYYKFFRGIRIVYLLNLVPFSKKEALSVLEEKLGWTDYGGKHHESRITRFVQSYLLPKKFGIDYRRATLSTQICTGQVSRREALKELSESPDSTLNLEVEMEYVAKKYGLDVAELEAIIARPAKSYRDYPNDEKRLELMYNLYRRLFGRRSAAAAPIA